MTRRRQGDVNHSVSTAVCYQNQIKSPQKTPPGSTLKTAAIVHLLDNLTLPFRFVGDEGCSNEYENQTRIKINSEVTRVSTFRFDSNLPKLQTVRVLRVQLGGFFFSIHEGSNVGPGSLNSALKRRCVSYPAGSPLVWGATRGCTSVRGRRINVSHLQNKPQTLLLLCSTARFAVRSDNQTH